MKKFILPAVLASLSLTSVIAFADTTDVVVPTIDTPSTVETQTEKLPTFDSSKLTALQAQGAARIKERTDALTKLSAQIQVTTITAEQKTNLTNSINAKITSLNDLGTKISQATDATSTKALVKSVVTDYRIFSVYIPQIRLEKRIYDLQNYSAKLTPVFTKVQTNIDAAKAKGKDVTKWQANLDSAKALVTTDTQKLSDLNTQVAAMIPANYPVVSKTTITNANTTLKSVATDLRSIRTLVKNPTAPLAKKSATATSTSAQ